MHVLLVEDESAIRDTLMAYLEARGLTVSAASSTEEGLGLLRLAPDVAVVDMRLPGKSGNEFILEAKMQLPGLRCLVYTGSVNYHLPQELKDLGLDPKDVLPKPLPDLDVLYRAIMAGGGSCGPVPS